MGDVEVPSWLRALPLAPEFQPSEAEFADPVAYVLKIEQEARQYGICKIVPPFPKAPRRVVLNNLNSSLCVSHDAVPAMAHGSSAPMARSMSGSVPKVAGLEADEGGKAKFTTRLQQLGWSSKRSRTLPQSVAHKLVWQSGEAYTLDQFEAKAKTFSRNRLGTSREIAPLSVETLFWKAAGEKAIAIEYANDIPGSAFAESSEHISLAPARSLKRKKSLDEPVNPQQPFEDGVGLKEDMSEAWEGELGLDNKLADDEANREDSGGAGCKLANSAWNMRNVARSPGSLLRFMPDEVPGVTSPMVYIGMLFSWFAWHVEDHELHSLNYLHMGASKTWYAVPGDAAPALEETVQVHGYGSQLDPRDAFARLGEKTTILSPEVLVAAGVPCCRLVQNAGEYVVTFPRAYHLGFSHGFNCGEAANFATPGWLDVAREAAARRAAMNYLPMLSHQQLLYLLAMSLPSRSPFSAPTDARSSRLKEKKRIGEEIVNMAYVNDVIDHNRLLGKLLDHGGASCLMLSDVRDSALLPPTLIHASPSSGFLQLPNVVLSAVDSLLVSPAETAFPSEDCAASDAHDCAFPLLSSSGCVNHGDCKGPYNLPDISSSAMEVTGKPSASRCMPGNDPVTASLPIDWGTLPCAACGVLCYAGMAVVQPCQAAAAVFPLMQTQKVSARAGTYRDGCGDNGLTGNLSSKADTKSADFHILPSPGPEAVLELSKPHRSAESACKEPAKEPNLSIPKKRSCMGDSVMEASIHPECSSLAAPCLPVEEALSNNGVMGTCMHIMWTPEREQGSTVLADFMVRSESNQEHIWEPSSASLLQHGAEDSVVASACASTLGEAGSILGLHANKDAEVTPFGFKLTDTAGDDYGTSGQGQIAESTLRCEAGRVSEQVVDLDRQVTLCAFGCAISNCLEPVVTVRDDCVDKQYPAQHFDIVTSSGRLAAVGPSVSDCLMERKVDEHILEAAGSSGSGMVSCKGRQFSDEAKGTATIFESLAVEERSENLSRKDVTKGFEAAGEFESGMDLSSLQLLAAVYEGDSEPEDEEEDPLEVVMVVRPDIGIGGRLLDTVGLSADAPWDGISRSLPRVDWSQAMATSKLEISSNVKELPCIFSLANVMAGSKDLGKVFVSGGVLLQGCYEKFPSEVLDSPKSTMLRSPGEGHGCRVTTVKGELNASSLWNSLQSIDPLAQIHKSSSHKRHGEESSVLIRAIQEDLAQEGGPAPSLASVQQMKAGNMAVISIAAVRSLVGNDVGSCASGLLSDCNSEHLKEYAVEKDVLMDRSGNSSFSPVKSGNLDIIQAQRSVQVETQVQTQDSLNFQGLTSGCGEKADLCCVELEQIDCCSNLPAGLSDCEISHTNCGHRRSASDVEALQIAQEPLSLTKCNAELFTCELNLEVGRVESGKHMTAAEHMQERDEPLAYNLHANMCTVDNQESNLGGDGSARSDLHLGECVTCQSTHDSFFDSFDELPTSSAEQGVHHKGCQDRSTELAMNCSNDANLTFQEVTMAPAMQLEHNEDRGCSVLCPRSGRQAESSSANCDSVNREISGAAADFVDSQGPMPCALSSGISITENGTGTPNGNMLVDDEQAPKLVAVNKGTLRPRLLCMEHAVEAQQRLEPVGGAQVLVVCHSRFADTEDRAKELALQAGVEYQWRSFPFQKAADGELGMISAAVEAEEENVHGYSDWVQQLGLSVRNNYQRGNASSDTTDDLIKDPASVLHEENEVVGVAERTTRHKGKKLKEKKCSVVGQWCGRIWRVDQLHPLLGGCHHMVSPAHPTVLPALLPLPTGAPNLPEAGRARKVVRPSRLAEYSPDGRPVKTDSNGRKSGRKRKILDPAARISEDGETGHGRVLMRAVVCSNTTLAISDGDDDWQPSLVSGRRAGRRKGLERGGSLDNETLLAIPMWEKVGKRKRKDQESAAVSAQLSSLCILETTANEEAHGEAPSPCDFQSQHDYSPTTGACLPIADSQRASYLTGDLECTGMKEQWSDFACTPVDDCLSPTANSEATVLRTLGQVALDDQSCAPGNPERIKVSIGLPVLPVEATGWDLSMLPRGVGNLQCLTSMYHVEEVVPVYASVTIGNPEDGIWRDVPIACADSLPTGFSGAGAGPLAERVSDQIGCHVPCAFPANIKCSAAVKGADEAATTQLRPCPDGAFHSKASKCCSIVGGFLQRGAKLQALKKLSRQRCAPVSEAGSPAATSSETLSQENISTGKLTTPRLAVRLKRKPAVGGVWGRKKLKVEVKDADMSQFVNRQTGTSNVQVDGGNKFKRLSGGESENEVQCDGGFTPVRVACGGQSGVEIEVGACKNEGVKGDLFSCTVVDCCEGFESKNLLEPPETPNSLNSSVSPCCKDSPSHGPSGDQASEDQGLCSTACGTGVSQPLDPPADSSQGRWIGKVRGRRTKSLGWKNCIQFSPDTPGEASVCQAWEKKLDSGLAKISSEEPGLNVGSCALGVEVLDLYAHSSSLTGTSTRVRRRCVSTPGMVDWGGNENDDETEELADLGAKEEEGKKVKKRKNANKSTAQRRHQEREGEFQCDIDGCKMGFDTEQDLQLHKRNRCTWKGCGKHFHMHKYLLQHRRVHLDDRPLKCPWKGCSQAFKWAWARTEHIRVHTGERPYKCTVAGCGQTFRFVSDFSRHKRNTGHRLA